MHILVGLLGSIITILVLLNRLAELGIDLGGLNPFLWYRRSKWKHRYHGNPIFNIESPMEVTALLMTAVAKSDGDMSSEEKRGILKLFEDEFRLSKKESSALMIASVYLLRDGSELREHLPRVIGKSLDSFTQEQADSALSMIKRVADMGNTGNPMKEELVAKINECLRPASEPRQKWN